VRLRSSYFALLISAVVLLASCGSGAKSDSDPNTGAIAFSLKWPGSATVSSKPSTEEDQPLELSHRTAWCDNQGLYTINVDVWDDNTGQQLLSNVTFQCSRGEGTITGVTPGTNRKLELFGKDLGGTILYRGTQSGIPVTAGSTNTLPSAITMSSLSSELTSIAITPANPSITAAQTSQLTAKGTYTDATTGDITSSVTWDSFDDGIASVDTNGLVTAISAGSVRISAQSGTVSGSVDVTVTGSAVLTDIAITPASPAALNSIGATQQLTATGTYDDGSAPDLTSAVTWDSSDGAVVSVSSAGLVTAIGNGSVTITATLSGITSNSVSVTVTITGGITLASIAVDPDPQTIDEGATQAFTATGTYDDGTTTQDLTTSVTWTSSVGDVATIDGSTGIATGNGVGLIPDPTDPLVTIPTNDTTITATLGAISGSAALTVNPLPLAPTGVTADGSLVAEQVTISWSAVTGATSYNIYWSTASGVTTSGGTKIAGVTATTRNHTGLTAGTIYYYIVTAENNTAGTYAVGESDASSASEVSDNVFSTSAPSVTGTTPTNDTTPTWSWSTGGGSGSYRYKLDDNDLTTGASATTTTTYTPTTPLAEGDHTLYVQEDRSGSWSPTDSFTITIDITAPNAPAVTGTTPTNDTTPTWDWNSGGGGGNGSYRYKLDDTDLTTGATQDTAITFTRGTAFGDGETHTLYVQESDAAGNWSTSGSFAIEIDNTAPTTAPTAPTDAGTYSTSNVTFSWTAATDTGSGIASYNLQVGTTVGGSDILIADAGNVLTYDATGSDGQTLYARVQAVDGAGNPGNWSGDSDGITIDTSAPGAVGTPTDAGTYTSSTTVTFNWTAATDAESGIASYNVQVGTTAGGNDIFDGSAGTNTYNATGADGQTLYARVQAVNGAGAAGSWSGDSDGITIDTSAPGVPGTPDDGVSGVNTIVVTTVTFTWTAATDSGSGIASYTLQVNTAIDFSGTDRFNDSVGNVLTYDVSGSDLDTLYARIYAVNGAGTIGAASGASDGVFIDLSADVTAPTTSSTSPSSGATGILRDATISITFSEAMDTTTITTSTFTVDNGVTDDNLTIDFSNANKTATFTPSAYLTPGTTYTVTISSTVTDVAGNSFAGTSWSFTVAASSKWGEMIWGTDVWGP